MRACEASSAANSARSVVLVASTSGAPPPWPSHCCHSSWKTGGRLSHTLRSVATCIGWIVKSFVHEWSEHNIAHVSVLLSKCFRPHGEILHAEKPQTTDSSDETHLHTLVIFITYITASLQQQAGEAVCFAAQARRQIMSTPMHHSPMHRHQWRRHSYQSDRATLY